MQWGENFLVPAKSRYVAEFGVGRANKNNLDGSAHRGIGRTHSLMRKRRAVEMFD